MPRDMTFQILGFLHAEVANLLGSVRRLFEHFLNNGESALVKSRAMIFLHVIDKFSLIIVLWVIICVARPCNSVVLAFVLVPFVSAVEEMIAEVAILVRTNIRLKVF